MSEWLPWNLNIRCVFWIFKFSKGFPVVINHTRFFLLPSLVSCNVLSGQKLLGPLDASKLCISRCLACLLHTCFTLPAPSLSLPWVCDTSRCSGKRMSLLFLPSPSWERCWTVSRLSLLSAASCQFPAGPKRGKFFVRAMMHAL